MELGDSVIAEIRRCSRILMHYISDKQVKNPTWDLVRGPIKLVVGIQRFTYSQTFDLAYALLIIKKKAIKNGNR